MTITNLTNEFKPPDSFAAIIAGERLTHPQLERRNQLLEFLVNYLIESGCCKKTPNWRDKLYSMKLQELEDRFEKMFGRKL